MKRLTPIVGAAVVLAFIGWAAAAFVSSLGGVSQPTPPPVQQISLVVPPPPPPKVEEPPPEPEMEEVDVPDDEPMDDLADADEPPPGEDLGLDADGVAGSDAFGLKAKKGGRGLIGGGSAHKWYAGLIQKDLQATLAAIDDVRKGRYTVIVKIWLGDDGTVEDSELVRGSGDPNVDQALRNALASGVRVSRTPPEDLPQPIRLKISSRS